MQKTKIEWCDQTWNPVNGCKHGCQYCYAEKIAKRFGKPGNGMLHDLEYPELITSTEENSAAMEPLEVYAEYKICPYPYGFDPTFYRYRLDEPQQIKKPQNIFVCSMADLFGEWVPDEWIKAVFEACAKAPQHRYLFLTKNPARYHNFIQKFNLPTNGYNGECEFWLGTTINKYGDGFYNVLTNQFSCFLSIEPIMGSFEEAECGVTSWIIVGAETGNRKNKVVPKREWVESIVKACKKNNTPIFMKDSLAKVWGEPLIQEYPWHNSATEGENG